MWRPRFIVWKCSGLLGLLWNGFWTNNLLYVSFLPLSRLFHLPTPSPHSGHRITLSYRCYSFFANLDDSQPSHKSFKTKRILGKAKKQNRPIPQWIRFRTDSKIRLVAFAEENNSVSHIDPPYGIGIMPSGETGGARSSTFERGHSEFCTPSA